MNILQRSILEVKLGDRFYHLECAPDSPLSEVNQALVEMNSYVLSRIEEAKKMQENSEEKVKEE